MPPVEGRFLVVDKPPGPTSHDVVSRVRRVLHTREVGHAGTLDPFASGVVVVLVGVATRLSDAVGEGTKRYRATARLGVETTTDDFTGAVTRTVETPVSDAEVADALGALAEQRWQVPPQFSAKHVQGRRAYDLARAGETVDLAAAEVRIDRVDLVGRDGPLVTFDVECGRGTYIRSMARDLGRALGVGAHLTALRRTQVGGCIAEGAAPLETLEERHARPMVELCAWLPHVDVAPAAAAALLQGKAFGEGVLGPVPWRAGRLGVVVAGPHFLALARAARDLGAGERIRAEALELGRRFPPDAGSAEI